MKMLNLTLFLVFTAFFSGCNGNHSAAMENRSSANVQPTVNSNANVNSALNAKGVEADTAIVKDDEDGNEITECSPQKVYLSEKFKVSFKQPHGKNLAIYNEKTRDFYFLTEPAAKEYFPRILPDAFEKFTSFEFDTLTVRSSSGEIGSDGYNKSKPYFDRTGWYRVIVGHQGLDVDFIDMPVTGSCRVYYVNKKRPSEK